MLGGKSARAQSTVGTRSWLLLLSFQGDKTAVPLFSEPKKFPVDPTRTCGTPQIVARTDKSGVERDNISLPSLESVRSGSSFARRRERRCFLGGAKGLAALDSSSCLLRGPGHPDVAPVALRSRRGAPTPPFPVKPAQPPPTATC